VPPAPGLEGLARLAAGVAPAPDDDAALPVASPGEGEALAESLVALMYLHAELAAAHAFVAGAALDPDVSAELGRFAADHLRHVEALKAAVEVLEVEVEGEEVVPAEDASVLLLVEALTAQGLLPALRALAAAEGFVRASHEAVLELPVREDVAAGLGRALEDVREHLSRLGALAARRAALEARTA
jgi:hypothetical protein